MPEGVNPGSVDKVVLAYSGGLDTSVILRWLQDEYRCQVVTFTADLGQGEELEPARAKAEMMGAAPIFVEDLRETFVRDYVFPMFRANALYEGSYLLGTSIARPLIAKRLVEIAAEVGADAIAHGATGKGNDQVRFELSAYALNPRIKVIAPWRIWDLSSRAKLIEYAERHQIPIPRGKSGEPPYSTDANLLHISYEGRALEDPWQEPPPEAYEWTVSPEGAPAEPAYIEITYQHGMPYQLDGEEIGPLQMVERLNELGGAHGGGADVETDPHLRHLRTLRPDGALLQEPLQICLAQAVVLADTNGRELASLDESVDRHVRDTHGCRHLGHGQETARDERLRLAHAVTLLRVRCFTSCGTCATLVLMCHK